MSATWFSFYGGGVIVCSGEARADKSILTITDCFINFLDLWGARGSFVNLGFGLGLHWANTVSEFKFILAYFTRDVLGPFAEGFLVITGGTRAAFILALQ